MVRQTTVLISGLALMAHGVMVWLQAGPSYVVVASERERVYADLIRLSREAGKDQN